VIDGERFGGTTILWLRWTERGLLLSRFVILHLSLAFNSLIIYGQLAQWAASRTDLFPTLLCERMGKMHSQGRPHSLAYTKRVIERVFKRPFDEVFEEFDEMPIGSGAIAQVCYMFNHALSDFIELKHFRGVQGHNEAGSTSTLLFRPKAGS
jgi:ABC1 atypical kinase-like domain